MQLAYLRDIFYKLNTPNTSLQGGHDDNIIQLRDKLKLFVREAELWQSQMQTLKQFIESNNTQMSEYVKICLLSYLSFQKFHFQDCISDAEI
jgi:hypothetical protein